MARTALTSTVLAADSVATSLTALMGSPGTTGAGNGVTFPNVTGQTLLAILSTGTTTTLSVIVGTTLFGQAATSFSVVLPATAGTYVVGPFHSSMDIVGSILVAVDFSSVTGITVAAVQLQGVY
jgi:hypothetical protein